MEKVILKEDVNENVADVLDLQNDFDDSVDEDELLALEQEQQMIDMMEEQTLLEQSEEQQMIDMMEEQTLLEQSEEQQMIDMMEEQTLLEQSEEQAMIDAYIEQQLIEQSLLDQTDEEAQIEYEDQQHEPTITVLKAKQREYINNEEPEDEEDDEPADNVPRNVAAHRQVLKLMRQRNHLDVYVKKDEIVISSFGITRLKYKLNDNGWQWILNYLKTGCYEDYGVDQLKVADIDCESRVKELIERGSNIARVPFLRETEAYIEICAFFRYGKLYFSIRRNDDFMNYLIEKGL